MRNTLVIALFLLVVGRSFTQQKKSIIVFESPNILLTQNPETKRYKLEANETYEELLFVKYIHSYFQVLDSNQQVFYIDANGQRKEQVKDIRRVCGTVAHYKLFVKETVSHFEVYEDEVFYDFDNKIPAEKIFQISKQDGDAVLFKNGKSKFNFTSNYSVSIGARDPRTLILVKDGKYYTKDHPDFMYDDIDFRHPYIKTIKNNLHGLLGIVEPKYKSIEQFNYYLAKAITLDNKIVYIDNEGNEYK